MTKASNAMPAPGEALAETRPGLQAPDEDTTAPASLDPGTPVAKRRRAKPAADPTPPAPVPTPTLAKAPAGKLGVLAALLQRPGGTTLAAMVEAAGWQAHSVRGAMAGALKKKFGLSITSEKVDGVRVYRASADGARS